MKFGVGQPATRKEDARFLTGRGSYVDDVRLPGAARAHVLRSPHAHAAILRVDASAARAAPGVLGIWTGADVAERLAPLGNELPFAQRDGAPPAPATQPHLATDKVRFVGQPVAFVVAGTLAQARDAAELIEVDYETLEAVTDPEAALAEGAPLLHDAAPGNRAYVWACGDEAATEAAFARAAHVTRLRVRNQRLIVASMEPRAIAAQFDADAGRWEIWIGSQGAHGIRARIAAALQVAPELLRVRTPDVGGGFGMKLMAHPEYGLTALAARELGRPVKWIGERTDAMLSDAQGRDLTTDAEAAFDAEGRLLGFRWRSLSNLGACYSSFGAGIHTAFSAPLVGGMYRTPTFHHQVTGVFTNTAPTDAYRGAGRPEVIYVTERLMERAAREMGVDPVDLRLRNLVTPKELPYATPGGMVFDSLDPAENVRRALEAADRDGFAARRAEAQARGKLLGFGACYYMERTGGAPVERAEIRLDAQGGCEIRVGTQSTGQGHETAWAQIVRQQLGLDWESIRLAPGDTDLLSRGGGTGGSRSLIMAGRVLLLAAEDLLRKAREAAAEHLEAGLDDLSFSAEEGGAFRIVGTDRTVRLTELAATLGGLDGEGDVADRESTFPNGCHAAEVEVDPDTGRLTLTRYSVIDDFGALVNPLLVAGQVHGGVAQGAGQALMEEARWDADGQPLTASFMDYAMPRAADSPFFSVAFNEDAPTPSNPMGVKGCGEAGAVAATPAVTLAALDALRSAGAEELDTPLTPERVWRALQAAQARRGAA
ncbi:xanthine dehydrogenase family protein molybdopterin-binding subunit [Rubrimonas sp.]|uniref:xanthine dehydrogenase family protein molybdopterin-binding subunit n=1 Tax=Rubrimonas sp. TaxID=2036015 RepID=UPI002FDEAAE8